MDGKPETSEGYIKIANELAEALYKVRIPGEPRQVFDYILRMTYGFNCTLKSISLTQISAETGIKRPNITRAINRLIDMNLILAVEDKRSLSKQITLSHKYGINKYFKTWKPLSKTNKALSKQIRLTDNTNATNGQEDKSGPAGAPDTLIKTDKAPLSKQITGSTTKTVFKDKNKYTPDQTDQLKALFGPADPEQEKDEPPAADPGDPPGKKNKVYAPYSKEIRLAAFLVRAIQQSKLWTFSPRLPIMNDTPTETDGMISLRHTALLQKWAHGFHLILNVDKVSFYDIKQVIITATNDDFWYKNILSPTNLRKHFDRLQVLVSETVKSKSTTGKKVLFVCECIACGLKWDHYSRGTFECGSCGHVNDQYYNQAAAPATGTASASGIGDTIDQLISDQGPGPVLQVHQGELEP